MSGHSKWSTIKHKKAATDAKRGKVFTRAAKEIAISAREGGGDPDINVRLRLAIDKAHTVNMPKDNITRAIKRGTGELAGGELIEITYEAYAGHGVGLIIEAVTDNRNRILAELRHALNRYGGALAAGGAVSWQFTRKGYMTVDEGDPDELFLIAADAGADDVKSEDDQIEVFTEVGTLQAVRAALEENDFTVGDVSVIYDPNAYVELESDQSLLVVKLVEAIEDLDDIVNVYSNLDLDAETLEILAAAG